MRFRVDRDVLADAVAWTARTLPSRPSVPVLAGIRMQADDALNVSSFDYEVSAEVSLPVTTAEPGTVLVSGRLLAEITRSLPDRPVEVATDSSKVVLSCGSATFTLLTMPVEDYPTLPQMPPSTGSVGSDVFAAAVTQVAVAAGRDDTLPVLTGVRVEIDGDTITLASTDRYRLAVRELRWNPGQPGISAAALVPARTLADTARSLTSGAEVSIALGLPGQGLTGQTGADTATGEGMIGFEGGGRRTTTRLLDGEFPKFRSLLPDQVNAVAELRRRRSSSPSSECPSWPNAARRYGWRSRPGNWCSRQAPATRHRRSRRSRPHLKAMTSRSPSTRSISLTGSPRSIPILRGSRSRSRRSPP